MILNTCAIRENAEQRVLGRLGEFAHLKLTNPELIVGVAGLHGPAPARQLLDQQARARPGGGPGRLPRPAGAAARAPPASRSPRCGSTATRPTATSSRGASPACARGSRCSAAATSSAPTASCRTRAAASAACRSPTWSARCEHAAARGLPRGRVARPDRQLVARRRARFRRPAARRRGRRRPRCACATPRRIRPT